MPRDSQPTKNRILGATERLFAERGYDAVSMRDIAAEAEVQLALIHYHFGTKLDLYKAVWRNRYTDAVANRRKTMLAAVDYTKPRKQLIRTLVEIFLLPLFKMKDIDDLKYFVALGARESVDPKEEERGVLKEFLDPPAKHFLSCFGRALPEVPAQEIAWGYQAMVGVSVLHIADKGRINRISAGKAKAADTESASIHLVNFCVGGWLLLADARDGATATEQSAAKKRARIPPPNLGKAQKAPRKG